MCQCVDCLPCNKEQEFILEDRKTHKIYGFCRSCLAAFCMNIYEETYNPYDKMCVIMTERVVD